MLICIVSKLKSLILGTINLISKIICCWRRRRRNSDSIIPVSVASSASKIVGEVAGGTNWDDDDWDSCEVVVDRDRPRTTEDHIAAYRHQISVVRQNSAPKEGDEAEQPEPDLFADMVPDIKRQRKVFVGQESPRHRDSAGSRLSAQNIDPIISMGADLENWDESANKGWEYDDEDMNEALKSHKRGKR